MFTAFVDTCALFPIINAELLLGCAEKGLYDIKWSDHVLSELSRVLPEAMPTVTPPKAERRIKAMEEAFPYAKVTGWENLLPRFEKLPDTKDAPVAAAALYAKADVIVMENLKDFPAEILRDEELFALCMDDFMCDLWELKPHCPTIVFSVINDIAGKYKQDWRSLTKRLATNYDMPQFASLVYQWHWDQNSQE